MESLVFASRVWMEENNAFISLILRIYFYKYDHKDKLSWSTTVEMTISMVKRISLICHNLLTFYENL